MPFKISSDLDLAFPKKRKGQKLPPSVAGARDSRLSASLTATFAMGKLSKDPARLAKKESAAVERALER